MVELKDMIRNTRKAQGLTQAQFAHMIGATTNSVSCWELGKAIPRIGFLKKMGLYSETQTAKEIGAKRLLDALGIKVPPRPLTSSEMDSLEHGNRWRLPKNSAFVSLDDGSVFVRARKIVSAFVTEECDGWHVGVTYERGNTEVYTSYSVDLYPDKEHALAALHDFMERLAAR